MSDETLDVDLIDLAAEAVGQVFIRQGQAPRYTVLIAEAVLGALGESGCGDSLPEFERRLRAAAKDSVETKCGRIQTREVRVGYELGIAEGVRLALGLLGDSC